MRKRIAVFIDVDNTLMEYDRFTSILGQIMLEGDIAYGKLYGVSDRRNRRIIDYASDAGFEIAAPSRIKRRLKGFDNRMLIDITELVVGNKSIHSVAVISYPADFVPLFAKLREYGIEIMSLDDIDKASTNLCDILISSKNSENEKLSELGRLPYSGLESEEEGSIEEMLVNAYGKSGLIAEEELFHDESAEDADGTVNEDISIFNIFEEEDDVSVAEADGVESHKSPDITLNVFTEKQEDDSALAQGLSLTSETNEEESQPPRGKNNAEDFNEEFTEAAEQKDGPIEAGEIFSSEVGRTNSNNAVIDNEAADVPPHSKDDLTGQKGESLDVLLERVKHVLKEIKDEKQ